MFYFFNIGTAVTGINYIVVSCSVKVNAQCKSLPCALFISYWQFSDRINRFLAQRYFTDMSVKYHRITLLYREWEFALSARNLLPQW
jgi:hypothetical protein